MGLLRWISKQLDDLDLADAPPEVTDSEPVPEEPLIAYPEFDGVLAGQLAVDLKDAIERLTLPEDRLYGEMLLDALNRNGVEPPAMPDDVLRIQKLLAEPDCDVPDLAAAITRDPAIAGRFVGIANSPLYARADRVRTVDDAVVRIGLRQTAMIVMAIVAQTKIFRAFGYDHLARQVHRHCLAAAVAGQLFARRAHVIESHAFMGGLLHDIGRIWMLSIAGDVMRQSRGKQQVSDDTLEAVTAQFHAGFGALVVEDWGFEDVLVAALRFHHTPSTPGYTLEAIPEHARDLTHVLSAGELMSHAVTAPDAPPPTALGDVCKSLGLEYSESLRRECSEAFIDFEQQVS